ncbi:MAG TPA: MBL fold metallo-hydrolase [Conexibacter sp.]|jgi:cyclase
MELAHARVRRLSRRVLVVEAEPAGSANAGIVIGDDRVLVIDTRVLPSFGAQLASAVTEATGTSVDELVVVNTHFHGDHVFGNGAFKGATIVATASAQAAQRREWDRQVEIFEELRPHQADEIKTTEKAVATVGLTGPARIALGGVDVELEPVGPAHTEGDLVAFVPAEDVAFVADLVFNGHWPSMWNADMQGWLRALTRLRGMVLRTVVPGHGPAGDPSLLDEMAACLRFLIALELDDDGGDEDAKIAASPFAGFLHRQRVAEGRQRVREQVSEDLRGIVEGVA